MFFFDIENKFATNLSEDEDLPIYHTLTCSFLLNLMVAITIPDGFKIGKEMKSLWNLY